ncbi:MAG: biopolymer transporter ExbD [Pseudomonadota bacterium]
MQLRARPRKKPRINLTPLIDVVFLLLIFFMASTTFKETARIKIQLPSIEMEQPEDQADVEITIQVTASGVMAVNGRELLSSTPAQLKRSLAEIALGETGIPVTVIADKNAPFQAVMTVMDVAAQLKLDKITFPGRKLMPDE